MKVPEEIVEKILEGSMERLYNIFVTLEGEYDAYDVDYQTVRYGIVIPFEIQDLWEDTPVIRHKSKNREVIVDKKVYSLTDFRTEKEQRRKMMVQAIVENTAQPMTIQPRMN